jgi:hypothetical protein
MRRVVFVAMLLVAAGCARKAQPHVPEVNAAAPPPAGVEAGQEAPADFAGPVYDGRTVTQWSRVIEDRDVAMRTRAAVALSNLGEPGFTQLYQGMLRSKPDTVRLTCLQSVTKPLLQEHQRQAMPLLMDMLTDKNPLIRQAAAARLVWFGKDSAAAVGPLQRLAADDPDPQVQTIAREAVFTIGENLKLASGEVTRGQKPKK